MTDTDAQVLAAQIEADQRQLQIRKIADQISTLCVIDRPSFYVALEALKHATMNMTVTMLLSEKADDKAVMRRIELALGEAQDLYRLTATLYKDIHQRGPAVALGELRKNITTLNAYLPEVPHDRAQ